jgi:antirestriction protein ArdC
MNSVAYEAVYNQIINKMNEGQIPWRKDWKNQRPCNLKSNRPYRGINFILLSLSGFKDHRWTTLKHATSIGGKVKKGEKSTQVVFWQILNKIENGNSKNIPILKYYNVFNLDQIEGIELPKEEFNQILSAEELTEKMFNKPKIEHGNFSPCYSPKQDLIKMPLQTNFETSESYYQTLWHELVHSTGHESRLNRKTLTESARFGSEIYCEEELVAELGSAFICAEASLDNTIQSSTSYIQGWMDIFKENPKMIVNASSKAQKAVDYLLNLNQNIEAETES